MTGLKFPKPRAKKKRKKHAKSIIEQEPGVCFLCARLNNDYSRKRTQEHHVFFGTADREKSEEMGLKANLCLYHHTAGQEAVHNNKENADLLRRIFQQKYEETHTHEEWMEKINKNYL